MFRLGCVVKTSGVLAPQEQPGRFSLGHGAMEKWVWADRSQPSLAPSHGISSLRQGLSVAPSHFHHRIPPVQRVQTHFCNISKISPRPGHQLPGSEHPNLDNSPNQLKSVDFIQKINLEIIDLQDQVWRRWWWMMIKEKLVIKVKV